MGVQVKKPTDKELADLGIKDWPIWEKEESDFDWHYDEKEICYFLEGLVEIELPKGDKVTIQKGDLAIFPEGLSCKWHVKKKVKKHYNFG